VWGRKRRRERKKTEAYDRFIEERVREKEERGELYGQEEHSREDPSGSEQGDRGR
jgi:hypothetical protein